MLSGSIINAKSRAGCRYLVYELAQKFHGKVRIGESSDGVHYNETATHNLDFQIVFKDESNAEAFENEVSDIPLKYGKRPNDSDSVSDIQVVLQEIIVIENNSAKLSRIKKTHYTKIDGTDVSPDFDAWSYTTSVIAVDINDETRLRLVDREDSIQFYHQKPESCHIISRKFKESANDPNNIVYMSRFLHQQYDVIDSTEPVSQFYLKYIRQDASPQRGIVNKKTCDVYATTVHVVFIEEETKKNLSPFFKRFTNVSLDTIEITLSFPDPLKFKEYSDKRMQSTLDSWASYRGIE